MDRQGKCPSRDEIKWKGPGVRQELRPESRPFRLEQIETDLAGGEI